MLFQYNNESVILLIPFFQGLVYSLLLLSRSLRHNRLSDRLLGFLLFGSTLFITNWMLGFAGWYDARDFHSTFMFYMPWNHLLVLGPLIYFYFRSKTNYQFHFQKIDLLHFMPWFLVVLTHFFVFFKEVLIDHWATGHPFPEFSGTKGPWAQWYTLDVFRVLELVSIFTYIILTLITYRQYRKYVYNHFSNAQSLELRWLRIILILFIIGMAGNFLIQLIDVASGNLINYRQAWISHLIIGIMIYFTAIYGYHSLTPVDSKLYFSPNEKHTRRKHESGNDRIEHIQDLDKWKKKVDQLIERKIFLRADISLKEMADLLNTNSSKLSKIINTGYNQNFNDFINQYRILDIVEKLEQGKHQYHTLTSIAFDSGFNSKATFNRAFKKHTHKTPREFIASLHL